LKRVSIYLQIERKSAWWKETFVKRLKYLGSSDILGTFHSVNDDVEWHVETDNYLNGCHFKQAERLRLGPGEAVEQPATISRRQTIQFAADDFQHEFVGYELPVGNKSEQHTRNRDG